MNRASRGRLGATRGQLALIGALAVALAWVLASNLRGSDENLASSTAAEAAPSPATDADGRSRTPAPSADAKPAPLDPHDDWPEYSLEELVGFDPLEAPAWLAEAEQASAARGQSADHSLEQLQTAENAIILVTGNQRIARIGTQEYHVGDMVGQFPITDISSAGILLGEPAENAHDAQ
jgi:hypothetical protein